MSDSAASSRQEEAYLAVLRAFRATECTNWGHQQLLRELREKLNISPDTHIECLRRVLRETENPATGVQEQKKTTDPSCASNVVKPPMKKEWIPGDRDVKRKETTKQESITESKKPRTKNLKNSREEEEVVVVEDLIDHHYHHHVHHQHHSKQSSLNSDAKKWLPSEDVLYLKLTSDLLHGFDECGLPHLYGQVLESFWEESKGDGDGKWYAVIVSDYNTARKEHKLIYDCGSTDETFEWVSLEGEIEKGNIRAPDTTPSSFHVGRTSRCGEPPFEENCFERMLKEGSREELCWMLFHVQRKIHSICSEIKLTKNPTSQDEEIVRKIVRRSQLIMQQRNKRRVPMM